MSGWAADTDGRNIGHGLVIDRLANDGRGIFELDGIDRTGLQCLRTRDVMADKIVDASQV